jgi:hypothetical protein
MRKIIATLALLTMAGGAFAQKADLREAMRESIRESLKEKRRTPVLISDAIEEPVQKNASVSTYESRVTINTKAIQEAEVSLAYHPADSSKVVISFMEESSSGLNFPIYYSSDGGQSWTHSSFNAKSILAQDHAGQFIGGGGDPAFAWDKNGRVYFSWIYLTLNASQDTAFWNLMYAYSDNYGQSWVVPAGKDRYIGTGALNPLNNSLFNIGDGVTDRQWFAVDNTNGPNQGKLYCSFLIEPADSDPNKFGEAVKVKNYNATAFGPLNLAFNGETQFGNLEVAPNGTLHMGLVNLQTEQVLHISSPNGVSFNAANTVANATNLFPRNQSALVHDRENGATNLAIDGNGILHMVWTDFETSDWHAYYSRSTDGGVSWSAQKDLNAVFTNRKAFMPTVAAAGKNVSISMSAIDNSDSASFYQIRSTDNGVNWSSPQLLSHGQGNYNAYTNNEFFGDYNRSVRSNCVTYAAWSDGRDGQGPKIYFTRTNICSTGIGEISTVNGNLQLESLYPNPASTEVTLQLNAASAGNVSVSISDISGRNVWSEQRACKNGKSSMVISFGSLAAGNYMLSVRGNDGSVITRQIHIR